MSSKNKFFKWAVPVLGLGVCLMTTSFHFPNPTFQTAELASTRSPVEIAATIDGISLRVKYQISGTGANQNLRILEVTQNTGEDRECSICSGQANHIDISISSRTSDNAQSIRDRINEALLLRMQNQQRRIDQVRVRQNGRDVDYEVELQRVSEREGGLRARVRRTTEAATCDSCHQNINLPNNISSFSEIATRIQNELIQNGSSPSSSSPRTRTEDDRRDSTGAERLRRIIEECRKGEPTLLTSANLSRINRRAQRPRGTTLESALREIDTEIDDTDDGEQSARSEELRCRVDKFKEIIQNESNIRSVTVAQARSFFNSNLRPHLLAALLDHSEAGTEAMNDATQMIEDLQAEPARQYRAIRTLAMELSSQSVREMSAGVRERYQRAIEFERMFPLHGANMQRLTLAQQQNILQIRQRMGLDIQQGQEGLLTLHGRLANANMMGLDSAVILENMTPEAARQMMNGYFLNTQPVLACAQSGFQNSQHCSSGLILNTRGSNLGTQISDPVYGSGVTHVSSRGRGVTRNQNGQIVQTPSATGFQPIQAGSAVRLNLTR